ncbi:heme-degrading domain-containing protein [Streptomyces sp. NPDC086766]|uniref:heme-degrading domain-containing protein n=1 Tax=Streptomyces sp. NPDC086766 TaxID=3365754 RepID=UPI00380BAAE7
MTGTPKPTARPTAKPTPESAPETTPSVEELEAQERRLVFRRFDHDDAWALGSLLVELARERQAPVAVDIHRAGQQLFHAALPGSTIDNDAWIARKRRVVERYGSASYLVGARFRAKGTTFEDSSRLDPDVYAAHGGSFPITVEGVGVIGAVTVSGLPQLQDHRFVVEALERFLDR